ncbi:MAG: SpoIIE family protein phosphatase [Bacteroidales bacterium]|nr:SpoIIE family protein phosphatase [Bacteroidales bacterium]
MPSLILLKSPNGPGTRQTYPLTKPTTVIGREENCDVVVPNNAVSRRHAKIIQADGQFILEDLKSRNKTYLNNREIDAGVPLKNDDRIKICDFLFLFSDERPATTKPAPLPQEFGPDRNDSDIDPFETVATTVQSSVPQSAAQQLLDVQPTERLRVLLDISTTLSKTLELEPLLPQIADSLFEVFRQADRCLIVMLDETGRLVPTFLKGRRPGWVEEGFSKTIVRKCLEAMKGYLTEDAASESSLAAAQSIASLQIRSVMCVPMATSEGKPLGVIQLDSHDYFKKFKEDDLKLLTIVGNLASVAVEKAKVHAIMMARQKQEQEIELAKSVQLGFLPQKVPAIGGYEFFAFYSAALSVGGDYYDFISLPGGKMAVVLGDVAGKGVPASLLMAKLSAEARFCMLTQPNPAQAVSLLNEQLIHGGIGDRFVTLAALVLDPVRHEVIVVNAGHINPLRYRSTTGAIDEIISDAMSGLPLGLVPGYEYLSVTLTLDPGDSLMLCTDGVTEAMNPAGELFGLPRVHAALEEESAIADIPPREIGERLVRAVRTHANGRPQNDDIALVCFGRLDVTGPVTGVSSQRVIIPESRPDGTDSAGSR